MKFALYLLQALVPSALAQNEAWGIYCDALGTYCGNGRLYILTLAVRFIDVVIYPLAGGIAVIGVIWASIKMIASFGNEQGKEDAKKIIGYSVIGILLCIMGYSIVKWVCEMVQFSTGGSGYCGT